MLSLEEYVSYKEAHNEKSLLDDVSIEFDYSDIKYIIVKSDANVVQAKSVIGDYLQESNIIILTKPLVEYDIIGSNHNIPVMKSQYEMNLEANQRFIQDALKFMRTWKQTNVPNKQ